MVVHRHRKNLLRVLLTDDILIQPRLDLGRGQDVDALQRIGAVLGLVGRCLAAAVRPRAGRRRTILLVQGVIAHVDAVLADIHSGADQDLLDLILRTAAKAANQFAAVSVPTGRLFCHSCPPFLTCLSVW